MYGAIIGDIVGSVYEFDNIKSKDFKFITKDNFVTDDTVMTIAVASALTKEHERKGCFANVLADELRRFGRKYPHAGYGGMFARWLESDNPRPYNSFGNGSAMRVSAVGLYAANMQEVEGLAGQSADVTHNHPEGVKGARATAAAVFLAKSGKSKSEIRDWIESLYGYDLSFTLDEIREGYLFNETCQETVPQAIVAFLESTGYEDAIRDAISIGGDSDTLAAITGGIAWAYYGIGAGAKDPLMQCPDGIERPEELANILVKYDIDSFLPQEFIDVIRRFDECRLEHVGLREARFDHMQNSQSGPISGDRWVS